MLTIEEALALAATATLVISAMKAKAEARDMRLGFRGILYFHYHM